MREEGEGARVAHQLFASGQRIVLRLRDEHLEPEALSTASRRVQGSGVQARHSVRLLDALDEIAPLE